MREIDRWREAAWDKAALPKTAFQEKKTDNLGIGREEAVAKGLLTREQLDTIKAATAAPKAPGRRRGDGDDEGGDGVKRRRREEVCSPEGRAMLEQVRQKLCFRTAFGLAPEAQPVSWSIYFVAYTLHSFPSHPSYDFQVVSLFQKRLWVGDLRVTHFLGVDMRCVLPQALHVYQRTVYDAVDQFASRPLLLLSGLGTDSAGADHPFRGAIMIARCEVAAVAPVLISAASVLTSSSALHSSSLSSASSSSSAAEDGAVATLSAAAAQGKDALDSFFRVLNLRSRVGLCQTLDNNCQCFVIPARTPPDSPPESTSSGDGQGNNIAESHAVVMDPLWRVLAHAINAADLPARGSEGAFIVILMRNLDGPTLCSSPGVGEASVEQAQQLLDANGGLPPRREPQIPPAPTFSAWQSARGLSVVA